MTVYIVVYNDIRCQGTAADAGYRLQTVLVIRGCFTFVYIKALLNQLQNCFTTPYVTGSSPADPDDILPLGCGIKL